MEEMIVSGGKNTDLKALKEAGADGFLAAAEGLSFSLAEPWKADETEERIGLCHAAGLAAYLNLNALFAEEEVDSVKAYLKRAVRAGADGIFFSDPMLMKAAEEIGCVNRMVYHPMTLLTSSYDAAWWMEQGILSAVISPVLTAAEIRTILQRVGGLTVQIHGRSLMSVSARSLLGAYESAAGAGPLRGRKGLYLQEEKREGYMPVYENERGTMICTDFVQMSFREITGFRKMNECRFLIEAAGMDEAELMDAVKAYREILAGADPEETARKYEAKYPEVPLSEGYYEQETIK